jgi:hypothetical protein
MHQLSSAVIMEDYINQQGSEQNYKIWRTKCFQDETF